MNFKSQTKAIISLFLVHSLFQMKWAIVIVTFDLVVINNINSKFKIYIETKESISKAQHIRNS